jgi:hypothetical protein
MYFKQSLNNTIYHNNFVNNDLQIFVDVDSVNFWDNGVEGNYWSDYDGSATYLDGIGDTPYIIDENNIDNYPLENQYGIFPEFPSWLIIPTIMMVILIVIGVIGFRKELSKERLKMD